MSRHQREETESLRIRLRVARFGVVSLGLLAAFFLVWFTSGIPPAFIGSAVRWLALGWLVVGIGCVIFARPKTKARRGAVSSEERRWRLRVPAWLEVSSAVAWVVLTVGLLFVVDGGVPALVLGPRPAHAVGESVVFHEAKGRRDVDRTRIRFESAGGPVEAWAADPDYTLRVGSAVVYDPAHPTRVMAQQAWAAARSTWWRLPVALLVWLASFAAPFVFMRMRTIRYGSLRPGRPVRMVTRPGRAKLLTVTWGDGPQATFIDDPGLAEALRARIDADGNEGVHVPGASHEAI